jgi:hypothetical protein
MTVDENKFNSEIILEQALVVFNDINKRINSLIDCSAKDFDVLNQSFREYYSTIKDLTENTHYLFNTIIELPHETINQNLISLDELMADYKKAYSTILNIDMYLVKSINDLSYSQLHINNLKQNISTLKLLTTNLQLEPAYRNSYSDLIEIINKLSICSQKFEKEFQLSDKRIKASYELIEQLKSQQFAVVLQSIKKLQKVISSLIAKKSDCLMYSTLLKELISKKSISSSEIVTNLQFQDIIRQKIEHVQHAHEALLEQLRNYYEDKKTIRKKQPEISLEIILQIRNIGSLQAAQLVHANSEYQKAVENITNKFGDLDYILSETLQILGKFLPYSETVETYFYKDLEKGISGYELEFDTFVDLNSSINYMYTDLIRQEQNLFLASDTFNYSYDSLNLTIEKLRLLRTSQFSNSTNIDTLSQIISCFDDFRRNALELKSMLDKNKQELSSILEPALKEYFDIINSVKEKSDQLVSSFVSFIPNAFHKNKINHRILNEKEINTNRFNIDNVGYYKIFEKEVDEIISGLNSLINRIDFDDIENKLGYENVERLKKNYTMRSEREIHDLITGNNVKEDQESHDIELF